MAALFIILTVIGFFAGIISGIAYLINAFRHKNIKCQQWWKIFVGSAVCFVIGLCGSGATSGTDDSSSHNSNHARVAEQKSAKKKKEAKKAAKRKKDTKKHQKASKVDREALALAILKNAYKGKAKVWLDSDDKSFMIQPTGTDFKKALTTVIATKDKGDWRIVTKSIDKVSRSVNESANLPYYVSIVNPENRGKVLYSSLDGVSVYDFMG